MNAQLTVQNAAGYKDPHHRLAAVKLVKKKTRFNCNFDIIQTFILFIGFNLQPNLFRSSDVLVDRKVGFDEF